MANFVQLLAKETIPDRSFDKRNDHIQKYINRVYDTTDRKQILVNPQIADVYSTYAYDGYYDYYIGDHDHYHSSGAAWNAVCLGVADNAHLEVQAFNEIIHGKKLDTEYQVKLVVGDRSITFKDHGNIKDTHKAAMMYTYVLNKLQNVPTDKAYGSRLHNIKLALEGYFKDLRDGKTPNVDLKHMLTEEEIKECESLAKAATLKKYLLQEEVIPTEKGLLKYPKTYEKFTVVAAKAAKKCQAIKQRNLDRQNRKKQKALVKQEKRELKLAKQKAKQEFKAKQEERTKSVKDVDFSY